VRAGVQNAIDHAGVARVHAGSGIAKLGRSGDEAFDPIGEMTGAEHEVADSAEPEIKEHVVEQRPAVERNQRFRESVGVWT